MQTTLDKLKAGQTGTVVKINGEGAIRQRMFDMGLTPGAYIVFRKSAPLGDPIELMVRQYELSIRKAEASNIVVEIT